MTPEELIAWHAHQIVFLPDGDNVMVKHHRDAMHCIERLRAEVAAITLTDTMHAAMLMKAEEERDRLRELLIELRPYYITFSDVVAKVDAALKEGSQWAMSTSAR